MLGLLVFTLLLQGKRQYFCLYTTVSINSINLIHCSDFFNNHIRFSATTALVEVTVAVNPVESELPVGSPVTLTCNVVSSKRGPIQMYRFS